LVVPRSTDFLIVSIFAFVGMRFGLMQSKMGLSSLLKNYKFTVNKKTIEPLKMKVKSFIPTAEGEIWLDAEKI
jgi:cytochrome P450 family 6